MSESESWTCPFCNHAALLRRGDRRQPSGDFVHPLSPDTGFGWILWVTFCPNEACKQTELTLDLYSTKRLPGGNQYDIDEPIRRWNLLPESAAKPFPDYIPQAILDDYREACLIASLSPKASATLSRRCLQGMIRNFWGISKGRLKDEIDALEEKVDATTWKAVDAVRQIGNVGAHMKADVNVIVDVDPKEADLLIRLIETLLAEWYVARDEREQRMAKISAAAEDKKT